MQIGKFEEYFIKLVIQLKILINLFIYSFIHSFLSYQHEKKTKNVFDNKTISLKTKGATSKM